MRGSKLIAAVLATALALGGCDDIGKALGARPKPDAAAVVRGELIGAQEVRAEAGRFASADPALMKAAQSQALERLIMRRLMAQAARDEKLQETQAFKVGMGRGGERLMAQLYRDKIVAGAPQPTRQEAEAYVASNAKRFAGRRFIFLAQVVAVPNRGDLERFRPLTSLEQVKAFLQREGLAYLETASVLDTLTASPGLVDALDKAPAGEVLMAPSPDRLVFNRIMATYPAPLTGEVATSYAMNLLRAQKAEAAVRTKAEELRKAADEEIAYAAAYARPASAAK